MHWPTFARLTLVASALTAPSVAQTPIHLVTNYGGFPGHQFGYATETIADIDGDGLREFAIGAPNSGNYGFVRIFSGATFIKLREHNTDQHGDRFGTSISSVGDMDLDGVGDYVIGAPNYDLSGPPVYEAGRAILYSGASGALIRTYYGTQDQEGLGWALADLDDVNGDLKPDILIGSAGSGAWVYSGNGTLIHRLLPIHPGEFFGYSVTGLGDLNGDGRSEFAVGGPKLQLALGSPMGVVRVYNGYDKSIRYTLVGPDNGQFGHCVRSCPDLTGDGKRDLLVGAPLFYGTQGGQGLVRIFSGANGGFLREIAGQNSNESFGSAIAAEADWDGDGWVDLVITAPNCMNLQVSNAGVVRAYSGATSVELFQVKGTLFHSLLGTSCTILDDVDGDGLQDLLAGSLAESYAGAGLIISAAYGPPAAYCTAKTNSLGCVPTISWAGTPSIATTDDFHVIASNVLSNRPGIMMYGLRSQAAPFFGGTLCVEMVVSRTTGMSSGGNPFPDCSGIYDLHFSQALIVAENFFAGQTLYAQFWSRDSGFPAPDNVGLTDGLQFTLKP